MSLKTHKTASNFNFDKLSLLKSFEVLLTLHALSAVNKAVKKKNLKFLKKNLNENIFS